MSEDKTKRELLKDKVVDLVKEFIKTEGGITSHDLTTLFGPSTSYSEVADALHEMPFAYDVRRI